MDMTSNREIYNSRIQNIIKLFEMMANMITQNTNHKM